MYSRIPDIETEITKATKNGDNKRRIALATLLARLKSATQSKRDKRRDPSAFLYTVEEIALLRRERKTRQSRLYVLEEDNEDYLTAIGTMETLRYEIGLIDEILAPTFGTQLPRS